MAMNPCRWPRPSSCDGLISMHGWGPSYSLIGLVSSWHRLRLTPAEDPAGCVPPSHHAYAYCIPHDWMRPPGPREHAPVGWMSPWLTCKDAFFPCIWHKCLKSENNHLHDKNLQLCNQKRFSWTYSPKMTRYNVIIFRVCCLFRKSHLNLHRHQMKTSV